MGPARRPSLAARRSSARSSTDRDRQPENDSKAVERTSGPETPSHLAGMARKPQSVEEHSEGKLSDEEPRRTSFVSLGDAGRQRSFKNDGFTHTKQRDQPGRLSLSRSGGASVTDIAKRASLDSTSKKSRWDVVRQRRSSLGNGRPSRANAMSASLRDVFLRTSSFVKVTEDPKRFRDCEAMLVYLNDRTWSSGEASLKFGRQVALALANGIPLLLAHEMPGIAADERHGCEFAQFFRPEQTPQALIDAGIYHTVAVPLKAGEYRSISISLLTRKLNEMSRALPAKSQDLRTVVNALHDTIARIDDDRATAMALVNADAAQEPEAAQEVEQVMMMPEASMLPPPELKPQAKEPTDDHERSKEPAPPTSVELGLEDPVRATSIELELEDPARPSLMEMGLEDPVRATSMELGLEDPVRISSEELALEGSSESDHSVMPSSSAKSKYDAEAAADSVPADLRLGACAHGVTSSV